jgi:hypothetical protein
VNADAQRRAYRRLLQPDVRRLLRRGDYEPAAALATALVEDADRIEPSRVHLVGAGPGDPGLLTLAALELLSSADVVFRDALITQEALRLCAPEAQLVDAGKRRWPERAAGCHHRGDDRSGARRPEGGQAQGWRSVRVRERRRGARGADCGRRRCLRNAWRQLNDRGDRDRRYSFN